MSELYKTVSFGSSKAALLTVGYRLYDSDGTANGARITSGVQNLAGGQFGALVTFPNLFNGRITWDTGEGSPIFASEEINPISAPTAIEIRQEMDANSTKLALLSPGNITIVSPVTQNGDEITVRRGVDLEWEIPGLGSLVGRDKLYFTVKASIGREWESLAQSDELAIIQIEETAGLVRLNGEEPDTGEEANASITVDDATAGDITIRIKAAAASELPLTERLQESAYYDVKKIEAGDTEAPVSGRFKVLGDVTRAVS